MAGAALTGLAAITEIASAANVKNAASTVAAKAAQIGSAVATGVATAAQWAWNVALNANPIGLIIIAIAAFVGAILWLWNNVDWFRNGVTAAWEAIKTGWTWLWDNAIKPGIDAFGAAFRWLWNSVLAPVTRFILNGFANLTDGIARFLDALSNIPGFEWAKDAADKMRTAATQARTLAGNLNDIPDNVPVTVSFSVVGVQSREERHQRYRWVDVGAAERAAAVCLRWVHGDIPTSAVAGIVHGQEFVMSAPTVAKYGRGFFEALNAGRMVDAPGGTGAMSPVGRPPSRLVTRWRLGSTAWRSASPTSTRSRGLVTQLVTAMGGPDMAVGLRIYPGLDCQHRHVGLLALQGRQPAISRSSTAAGAIPTTAPDQRLDALWAQVLLEDSHVGGRGDGPRRQRVPRQTQVFTGARASAGRRPEWLDGPGRGLVSLRRVGSGASSIAPATYRLGVEWRDENNYWQAAYASRLVLAGLPSPRWGRVRPATPTRCFRPLLPPPRSSRPGCGRVGRPDVGADLRLGSPVVLCPDGPSRAADDWRDDPVD